MAFMYRSYAGVGALFVAALSQENATREPSGDTDGAVSWPAKEVKGRAVMSSRFSVLQGSLATKKVATMIASRAMDSAHRPQWAFTAGTQTVARPSVSLTSRVGMT